MWTVATSDWYVMEPQSTSIGHVKEVLERFIIPPFLQVNIMKNMLPFKFDWVQKEGIFTYLLEQASNSFLLLVYFLSQKYQYWHPYMLGTWKNFEPSLFI